MKRKVAVKIATALMAIVCSVQASARDQTDEWNGSYVGLDLGYGWGSVKRASGNVGGALTGSTTDIKQNGMLLGGYAGHNWLLSTHWLLGAEANIDWMDMGTNHGNTGSASSANLRWEGSIRGRLGFLATPSMLLYATGGYSLMDGSLRATTSPIEVRSATFDGWTAGLGSEWEVYPGLLLRLQDRYSEYGAQRLSFPAHGYDIGAAPRVNMLTAGISLRF
jgi:outer membrane immunogenic protein